MEREADSGKGTATASPYPSLEETLRQKDISVLKNTAEEFFGGKKVPVSSKEDLVRLIHRSITEEKKIDVILEHLALLDTLSYESVRGVFRKKSEHVYKFYATTDPVTALKQEFFVAITPGEERKEVYLARFPQEIHRIIRKNKETLKALRGEYTTLVNLIQASTHLYGVISFSQLQEIIQHYRINPICSWSKKKILDVYRHRMPGTGYYAAPYFAEVNPMVRHNDTEGYIKNFLKDCLDIPFWYPPTLDELLIYSYQCPFYFTEEYHRFEDFIRKRIMRSKWDMDDLIASLFLRLNRGDSIEEIAMDFETQRNRPEKEGDHEELLRLLKELEGSARFQRRRGHTKREACALLNKSPERTPPL